jgi:hypothetical protein
VRTVCHVLEFPREGTKFPRGQFFGIVCMDFKLPDDQLRLMRQHLFFETALVTFPFPEGSDLEPLSVEVRPQPDEPTGGDKVPNTPHEVATAAAIPADGKSTSSVGAIDPPARSDAQIAEDRAIAMQENTLNAPEIQQVLHTELKNVDAHSLLRDITRIPFRGKGAFVLPLGVSDERFKALFFYPRSPKLPPIDNWLGVLGSYSRVPPFHLPGTVGDCGPKQRH